MDVDDSMQSTIDLHDNTHSSTHMLDEDISTQTMEINIYRCSSHGSCFLVPGNGHLTKSTEKLLLVSTDVLL